MIDCFQSKSQKPKQLESAKGRECQINYEIYRGKNLEICEVKNSKFKTKFAQYLVPQCKNSFINLTMSETSYKVVFTIKKKAEDE